MTFWNYNIEFQNKQIYIIEKYRKYIVNVWECCIKRHEIKEKGSTKSNFGNQLVSKSWTLELKTLNSSLNEII